MKIGDRIREARLAQNLTQQKLGKLVGVSKSTINNYENDARSISSYMIIKLISVLHVDANFLFQDYFDINEQLPDAVEQKLLEDYRGLDAYGRKNISDILENEKSRINEAQKENHFIFRDLYLDLDDLASSNKTEAIDFMLPDTPFCKQISAIIVMNDGALAPEVSVGELLFFKRSDFVPYGQTGVFKVGNSILIRKMGEMHLHPLNEVFDPIPIDKNTKCLGKIIGRLKDIQSKSKEA